MHSSGLSGSRLSPRGSPGTSPKPPSATELASLGSAPHSSSLLDRTAVPSAAALRRRTSLTSDTGVDGVVESLSAFRHYNHLYMGYRADHLSQGAVALYRLGASSGAQKDWRDHYTEKLEPPNTKLDGLVLTRANWREYWGKQEAFRAYLRFFEGELVRLEADTRRTRLSADIDNAFAARHSGAADGASAPTVAAAEAAEEAVADADFDAAWQKLIAEYYPLLSGGMLGSALHPTIQAGWAVPLLREAADSLAHARAQDAAAAAASATTGATLKAADLATVPSHDAAGGATDKPAIANTGTGVSITVAEPPAAPLSVPDALALRASARGMLIEGLAWSACAYFPPSLTPPSPSLAPARPKHGLDAGQQRPQQQQQQQVCGGMALQRRLSQLYTAAFAETVQFFTRASSPPATPAAAAMRATMGIDGDSAADRAARKGGEKEEEEEGGTSTAGKGAHPAGLPRAPGGARRRSHASKDGAFASQASLVSAATTAAAAAEAGAIAAGILGPHASTPTGAGLTDTRPTRLAIITLKAAARALKGGPQGLMGRLAVLQAEEADARHTRWVAERTVSAALAAASAAGAAPGAGTGAGAVLEAVAAPLAALLAVIDFASGNDFFALHCVTGFFALRQILPLLPAAALEPVLIDGLTAILHVYVAEGLPGAQSSTLSYLFEHGAAPKAQPPMPGPSHPKASEAAAEAAAAAATEVEQGRAGKRGKESGNESPNERGGGGGIFCLMGSPHDPTLLPSATATEHCNTHSSEQAGPKNATRINSRCGPSWAMIGTRAFFASAHEVHPTKLAFVLACDTPLRSSARAKTALRRRRRCRPTKKTPADGFGADNAGAVSPVRAEPWAAVEGDEFRSEVKLAREKKAKIEAEKAAAEAEAEAEEASRSKSKGKGRSSVSAASRRLRSLNEPDSSGDDAFSLSHRAHNDSDDDDDDDDGHDNIPLSQDPEAAASKGGASSKGKGPHSLRIDPSSAQSASSSGGGLLATSLGKRDINAEFEAFDADRRARARIARGRLLSALSAIECDAQEADGAAADAAADEADAQSLCTISSVVTVAAAARGVVLAGLLPRGLVDVPSLAKARAAGAAAGAEGHGLRHRHTLDGHALHSTAPTDEEEVAEAAEWLDGLARITALQALPEMDRTE